jgi:glycosyltransferase 2 family protein
MRRLETIIVVLALGFYAWFLSHYGTREVLGYVQLAGWGLALTISLEAFARLANTLGWWVTIGNHGEGLRFGQLFAARIAGEAVDYVTPSAQLGGQFVMAMLVRRNLKMAVGLSTVVIAALCEMVGQIGFITLALLMSIDLVPRTSDFFWAILGGLAIALGLIGGFFYVQRKHPFSYLIAGASKLPGIDADEYRDSAAEADQFLLDFYAHHHGQLALSSLCYLFAWSLGPVEIYLLLRLLHQPAGIQIALLVEAVGLLVERATFLIPAKLVSQEGGKALILALLGYPAGIGFAIGFLRRVKEMVWVLFGLLSLMLHRMRAASDSNLGHADKMVALGGRNRRLRMKAEESQ